MDKVAVFQTPRALPLVLCAFAGFGAAFGGWLVLLADLQQMLSFSPGGLGLALSAGMLLSLPVMVLSGRACDRLGAGAVMAGAGTLMGLALVGTALVDGRWLLLAMFLLFYAATGAYDVGINAAAIALEQASGQRLVGYCHAAFSGAAALSAGACGVLLAFGVPFRTIHLALGVLACLLAWGIGRSGALPAAAAAQEERAGSPRYPAPLLLLACVVALAFLSEGELGNWSAIYLRNALELPAFVGASGVAVFHAAMFAGRLLGARAVLAFGRRALLRAAGAAVALGMALALATTAPPLILVGLLVVGLALAVVAPSAYSLAGDLAPDQAGRASSFLTTVGYGGYLLGPILVGALGEVLGLRAALSSIVLMGVLILALSFGVRREGGAATHTAGHVHTPNGNCVDVGSGKHAHTLDKQNRIPGPGDHYGARWATEQQGTPIETRHCDEAGAHDHPKALRHRSVGFWVSALRIILPVARRE